MNKEQIENELKDDLRYLYSLVLNTVDAKEKADKAEVILLSSNYFDGQFYLSGIAGDLLITVIGESQTKELTNDVVAYATQGFAQSIKIMEYFQKDYEENDEEFPLIRHVFNIVVFIKGFDGEATEFTVQTTDDQIKTNFIIIDGPNRENVLKCVESIQRVLLD